MALFLLAYNSIVSALAVRQPFVALRSGRLGQRNMRKTVMLDYTTYPLFYSWAIAMRHEHIPLGLALLFQLLAQISLVSLSANLFRAAASRSIRDTSIILSQEFTMDLLDSRTNMQPALNLADALHVHGAAAPSWMNKRFAFGPFQPTEQGISGNFTAKTSGLSSSPNCRLMDPSEYTAVFEPSDEEGVGFVTVPLVDRGCNITRIVDVAPSTPIYAQSWYQQCRGEQYDRIGVLAGLYSDDLPGKLQNLTIVSCMPEYWNSTVSLTMTFDPSRSDQPHFVSATTEDTTEMKVLAFDQIHRVLHLYTFHDPSAMFRADILGKTIYQHAQILNSLSVLDSLAIEKATEAVYETMFAALASTELIQPRSSPSEAPAQMVIAVERLYVNEAVAWAVLALLSAMLLGTIGSAIVVRTTTSILREEPKGLLSYARLLDESDVSTIATLFKKKHPEVDNMREFMKKYYRMSVAEATCYYDEQHGKIRMDRGGLETYCEPEPGFMSRQRWAERWEKFNKWIQGFVTKIKRTKWTSRQRQPGSTIRLRRQGRQAPSVLPR
ncbi:uncharacterized protein Z519_03922 [Cladophialophora bantiana CBS 173.52]|uniref:Uncharacterized protein n=1 Tax=Cladophialophora bantiana (strain ATCC 10958 / CBS 173.52 / CDC B-1940 / NIH 8579) TaxID=1442370 RepID=A0A0D2HPK3_CLAB1|nr:uncharacterized protein Z519_03922 [Cladophialophora bantiana CBS 173.52]KIW95338.1 hypothetical protein Z519_03922 [Cladophialophora bantiana CBS 173.52]